MTLINNVEIYPFEDFGGGDFAIDYHGYPEALFTPISADRYRFRYAGIAEFFSFYTVSLGDLIDPNYVEGRVPFISNSGFPGDPGSADFDIAVNESRYLGYWVEDVPTHLFGWVRVSRTVDGLVASESATSLGNGIYVGSFEEVPEPSVSVLGLSAVALLLGRRRGLGG
ncbi:MAG: hypothetical protein ACSHYF_18525 [Verrucomicrobiaceae bacterium]